MAWCAVGITVVSRPLCLVRSSAPAHCLVAPAAAGHQIAVWVAEDTPPEMRSSSARSWASIRNCSTLAALSDQGSAHRRKQKASFQPVTSTPTPYHRMSTVPLCWNVTVGIPLCTGVSQQSRRHWSTLSSNITVRPAAQLLQHVWHAAGSDRDY